MDMYKKKPLKFSGLGRDVRSAELYAARRSSRLQRFSLLRPIDDIDQTPKEEVPTTSRIPTFGKEKSKLPLSRVEMLKKWKEEKMLKKKIAEQSKKPVFKFSCTTKPQLSSASSNISKYSKCGELSRIQSSQSSKNPSTVKTVSGMKSKDSNNKLSDVKTQATGTKFQTSKGKIDVIKPPTARSQAVNTIPQASKFKTDNVTIRKPKPLTTIVKPLPKENKKDSTVPSLTKPAKVASTTTTTTITTDAKASKKTTSSGVPKPLSFLPQRKLNIPSQSTKPTMKSSNPTSVKQPGLAFKKPAEKPMLGKVLPRNESEKSKSGKVLPKNESEKSKSREAQPEKVKDCPVVKNSNCQPSFVEAEQKSFAPEGFVFRPPIQLQDSWIASFLDHTPFEIFERLKNEMEENGNRTSTPKQSAWKEFRENCNDSGIQESPKSTNSTKSKMQRNSGSIPSSETNKFIDLLINSPSEINLEHNFSTNKSSENEHILDVLPQKENIGQSLPKADNLETLSDLPSSETVPLDVFHPKLDGLVVDTVGPKQPLINLSDDTNPLMIDTETNQSKNEKSEASLNVPNETKEASVDLLNNSPSKIPQCSPELKQSTAFDPSSPEKDRVKDSASEVSLLDLDKENIIASESCFPVPAGASNDKSELDSPQRNRSGSLPEINLATNRTSVTCSVLNKHEEDEAGSLSDTVFEGRAMSNRISTRYTRSYRQREKPSLLKISESPEICKTPKRPGRGKALEKTPTGDFTPRRSARLARLSEFHSLENLFDVTAPSYCSPVAESSRLTYDFDRLHLESGETSQAPHRYSTRSSTLRDGKVSLLYTPPRARKSTRNKSFMGDLMSFSPSV